MTGMTANIIYKSTIQLVIQWTFSIVTCRPHVFSQTCPEAKPGVLNFHVVPYWRLEASDTFESLYENWAKPTLSAVVEELSPNSPRRFSFDQTERFS
ncbi:hypothetical protein MTO96_048080 [Rhipicephalus appendiculatus]